MIKGLERHKWSVGCIWSFFLKWAVRAVEPKVASYQLEQVFLSCGETALNLQNLAAFPNMNLVRHLRLKMTKKLANEEEGSFRDLKEEK